MAERIDDLGNGLKVIQNPEYFCFGVDAVLLANYVTLPEKATVSEFCAGNAVISILIADKYASCEIVAVEVQKELAELAERSVALCGMTERIRVIHDDILHYQSHFKVASLDAVIVNPPYVKKGGGLPCGNVQKSLARQESTVGPDEMFRIAETLLKPGGEIFMVHRPDRLVDLFCAARKHGVEPRELTMVQPSPIKAPNICLIKFKKGAGRELKMLPPIHVYDEEGSYNKGLHTMS